MSNVTPVENTAVKPTPNQLGRTHALKRFNLLFVYLPIAVGVLILIGVIGFISWLTFGPQAETAVPAMSSMADLILILIMLPLTLIGLLGPAALIGIIYWIIKQRQQKKERPNHAEEGILIQKYAWQIETILDKLLINIQSILSKAVKPVIQLNVWLTSVEKTVQKLWKN